LDESISGPEVLIGREPQKGTDLIIAVIGKALAVCYQHQKQVEQQFMMGEDLKETVSKESMLDKGKGACDLPESLGVKRGFLNHG